MGSYATASYRDITREFVLLGWTAFGGPAAHIGLFQKVRRERQEDPHARAIAPPPHRIDPDFAFSAAQRFVDKLRWMSNEVFIELYALGQCLPGPSSTQVSFAIGTVKQGVSGAGPGCRGAAHA